MTAEQDLATSAVEQVMAVLSGVEVEAAADRHRTALTRFANSVIHQNVAEDATTVRLRIHHDGRTIYDSHTIIDWLVTTRGWHDLAPARDRWHEQNVINAIDGALDAVIQLFYLRRDGVTIAGSPYEIRQLDRADAIFAWLGNQLTKDGRGFGEGFGLAELALITALDWMDFRNAYPTERASVVESVRAAWRDRPSLASTRPQP